MWVQEAAGDQDHMRQNPTWRGGGGAALDPSDTHADQSRVPRQAFLGFEEASPTHACTGGGILCILGVGTT